MVQGENYAFFLKVPTVLCTRITISWSLFFQLSPVCRRERYKIQFMVEVYFVTNDVRRLLRTCLCDKPLRNTVERYTHSFRNRDQT